MAAAQLTSPSPLAVKSFPSLAVKISNVNFSLAYPTSTSRSLRSLVVIAASVSAIKYTSIKPLSDRVLIKTKTAEATSSGGIFLPTGAQPKPQSGEVVAVGTGKKSGDRRVPVAVQAGCEVVYSKYSGTEVEVDGTTHLILKEDDIIGILEMTDDVKDLKLLNDRVLIKVAEVDSRTAGGLFLSEASKDMPSYGTIVATGPGSMDEEGNRKPLPVSPGNTVLYSQYAGEDLKGGDGSVYIALKVSDVLAVLS